MFHTFGHRTLEFVVQEKQSWASRHSTRTLGEKIWEKEKSGRWKIGKLVKNEKVENMENWKIEKLQNLDKLEKVGKWENYKIGGFDSPTGFPTGSPAGPLFHVGNFGTTSEPGRKMKNRRIRQDTKNRN